MRLGSPRSLAIDHPVSHFSLLEALLTGPLESIDPSFVADKVADPVPSANIVEDADTVLEEAGHVQPCVASRVKSGREIDADAAVTAGKVASRRINAEVLSYRRLVEILADDVAEPSARVSTRRT